MALVALLPAFGCHSMWSRVRENERIFALERARADAKRGNCVKALKSLDRAEAIMAIDRFAIEAIQMRIRCYEKLGVVEPMNAHQRLLDDYYREEPMAFPAHDGSSTFRVRDATPQHFDRPPAWLAITRPRYSTYARRSKIVGRVVVTFHLAANGKTTDIRVLEMPHPLLASWAIEAVAAAKPARGMKDKVPVIESDRAYVSTFNFEWRWADEPEPTSSSSAPLPR
jgi:TonB family protein